MKSAIILRIIAMMLCLSVLTSCAVSPEATSAGVGVLVGGVAAAAGVDGGVAALAGLAAAGITYAITKSYQMDRIQRYEAEQYARQIARSPKAKQHRYCAVPVRKKTRKAGQPAKDLVVVDTKSGQVVGDKAYETTDAAQLKTGNNVKVGGYDAYVFQGL